MNAPGQQADESEYCIGGYRPPQFDIRFLLYATTGLAVWITLVNVTSLGSKIVLAVVLLTFLFGCGRTRRAVAVVAPCLFLPYVFLLFGPMRYLSEQDAQQWSRQLWQLPGVLAAAGQQSVNDPAFILMSVIATLAVFFAFVMLARVSRLLSGIAGGIALLFTVLNCLICLAMIEG